MTTGIFFNKPLRQDDIFTNTREISLTRITGRECRRGLDKAIISNDKIVNVVSHKYAHMTNEFYFGKVEQEVKNSGLQFDKRSINRDDRSFCVDYILSDENYHINIKNGMDKLRPMLTFVNAYDGSCRTSGTFGFFREVCANGLHVATTAVGFKVKHSASMHELVLPKIHLTFEQFMKNEFYELQRKFEVLADKPITDLKDFVKVTAQEMKLFKYESSEQNPEPGQNARTVLETIAREAETLNIEPNFWIGYNAFNEIIHDKLKKPFGRQQEQDKQLLQYLLEAN